MKVKRKDADGKENEIEIEEKDLLETDVKVPEQDPGPKAPEKTLTQAEVNKILADERRKHEAKLKELETEYRSFKQTIEQREEAANKAAAEKVEALRKDLPDPIVKLLDKLTPIEQLEWLNDPENAITKKEIPPLPGARDAAGKSRKSINIV